MALRIKPRKESGEFPESQRMAQAAREALRRQEAVLRHDSLSLAEAAARTGASVTRLAAMVERGEALAVPVEGEIRMPSWQLRRNELHPILPSATALADSFPGRLATLHDWLAHPQQDLGGSSPAELLEAGDVEPVFALIALICAAGR
jgi:hypothetical protein